MNRPHPRSSAADSRDSPRAPAVPKKDPIPCVECTGRMYLRLTRFGLAYLCQNWPECSGVHGAHPNGDPMGTPASKDGRMWRIRAHAAFDTLWSGADKMTCYEINDDDGRAFVNKVARKRAYAWLRTRMDMTREQCHIAEFDIPTCQRVIEICRGMGPELVRQWVKERQRERLPVPE